MFKTLYNVIYSRGHTWIINSQMTTTYLSVIKNIYSNYMDGIFSD